MGKTIIYLLKNLLQCIDLVGIYIAILKLGCIDSFPPMEQNTGVGKWIKQNPRKGLKERWN
ncbi:hypothetical protein [Paenibacillus sp. YYML68]|uniref:hypothetical protein n=1 Tax=Paenibacillus sp. YYML68 TaxID=2909250 RepID=UPI00249010D0|nr:hypothetical protein [Paenibacillus sp. YYML68]